MIEEIWKDIPGYDGYYQVSNLGRVKSLSRTYTKKNMNAVFNTKECIKKPVLIKNQVSSNYYTSFSIDGVRQTFTIMKLVGLTFLGETKKGECYQHKNKNTLDNRVENIEIVTHTISKKNDFTHKLRTVHNIEAFKPYCTKKIKNEK